MGLNELCRLLGVVPSPVLAGMLQLEETTLVQWRKTGQGPKRFRVGNQHFYRLEEVKAFIEGKADEGVQPVDLRAVRIAGELS